MKHGKRTGLLVALFAISHAFGATVAEKPKPGSQLSTYMTEVEAGLGNIQPDGTLKLRYPLCESDDLRLLGVQCDLVHFIETDAYGRPRSTWRIVGLQTSLVPRERSKLLWRPLATAPVEFNSASIGRSLADAGAVNWRIRESRSNEYEIRSLDGRGWRYIAGLLVSAEHPALGELKFETLGSWIRTIRRADEASDSLPLLEVTYDASAKPLSLRFGSGAAHIFKWNDKGFLISWQKAEDRSLTFGYRDGLLEKIAETKKPVRQFAWVENPQRGRGDSRWAAPVHLASDGENTYDYDLTSKGFVIRRREVASGHETVTVFNPRRRRLEQRAADKAFVVTFRGEGTRMTALERIESGHGEILEEYRYDERGQLVGIKRKGEPQRSLSYDETGRLMTLVEGNTP